ncbi:hypothetical protein O181_044074 [Austropuccinia psidii MF-1]|uniref:Integrase catalytic domain-containing protein n=1 Tax=Austropuccinia psidii MF-1 TaxID=1389203 RepID=A0A9Q3DJK8_9BASI|nr:hypothetical protein [Austropuccinia psidii MF-1]
MFKKLYALETGTEDHNTASERRDLAFEILCINCNVKIAAQLSAEANNDPMALWTSIDNLIDDKTIKPSILLDSVAAMWTIRNLPEEYKTIGELWLKKCKIEKVTPLLKDTIEELHAYLFRTEDDEATEKSLAARRNRNQSKPKTINRCSNTYHNPSAQHPEEECWKLHPEKRPKFDKPVKALLAEKNPLAVFSFVLDSGATASMVNQLEFFQSIEMKDQEIKLAGGSTIKALGCGTIQLKFQNIILTFSKTLYIPSLATNLISMTTPLRTHLIIKLLNKDKFEVIDKDMKQIVTGSLASGNLTLYYMPKVLTTSAIPGSILTLPLPFCGNFPQATRKLEFIHMDLCGPISPPSVSGAQYIFRVLDGYSHFAWIFFLSAKSETKSMLKNLISKIERQSNNKVTNIVSDNGKEFVNSELQKFFNQKGISHLTTAPYTPQKNPFAERGNQTTINKARIIEPGTVPNPTATIPNELSSALQNQTNDSNIPITQENPSTKQSLSNEEPIATQITLPVHKGYSWVTEKESIPQNKLFGDVGNPGSILPHQRCPRNHANLADHLSLDPKTYQEAVNGPNSQEWKVAIKSELNNMTNHHVWTPITPNQNVKPLSTT